MREQRSAFTGGVGGSSLLVIFAVLCLTVFAVLALSTARADQRLADAAAKAVTDYYAADEAAERILTRLRRGETPAGVTSENGVYTYACPISETQELQVRVRIAGENEYTILRWQAVSTVRWQAEDSLDVWDGTGEE